MRTLEQITADTKPFAPSVIKQVPPRNEDYVSWTHYAQRLLLAHGAYRYSVTNIVGGEAGWAVAVRIQFGEHEYYDGVGFDPSDATHAESQAFKRACSKAGIGLHLYGDFWLHGLLTKPAEEEVKKTRSKDYLKGAQDAVLGLVGGDKEEAVKAWPLVLEAARVEKVTTKKEYEAVVRAANDTLGDTDG